MFGFFTPYNSCTAKKDIEKGNIRIIEWGELPPNYDVKQELVNNYGFEFYQYGGNMSVDVANSIKRYNKKVSAYLGTKFGKDWQNDSQKQVDSTVRARAFILDFESKNFMDLDLTTAIQLLGNPETRYTLNTVYVPGFQIVLLNFFPPDENILIEELTWDISNRVGDNEGKERLTIWYPLADKERMPVHYFRWNIDWQF